MTQSQQLLAEFVRNRSEEAFKELVSRYVDLVYSAALRLVEGDAERAKDVAQTVFSDLARMAPQLSRNSMLGGWLHRRACFVARTLMRGERRRQARERQVVEMSAVENQPDTGLEVISPVLDEAIHELGADDRDAILLRFFEQRSLRSVGDALGTSENVAQKRVARAVQELALMLKHRGYTLPAAALASGLAVAAVNAAPPGLALALAKGALAGSGVAGSITTASKAIALTKLKVGVGALIIIGIGTALWLQHSTPRWQPPSGHQPPSPQAAEEPAGARAFLPDPGTTMQPGGTQPSPGVPQPPVRPGAAPSELADASPVPATQAGAALPIPFSGGAFLRRLYSQPGSRLTIEGINLANRHGWQAESSLIEGFMDVNPIALVEASQRQVEARAEVSVPIRSLKSADDSPYSDAIDQAWYKALKAANNPEAKAVFYLSALVRPGPVVTNSDESAFEAKGGLVVAGVTNRITMGVHILALESEKLKISGTTSLGWTSEAVDPFSVMTAEGNFSPDTRVTMKLEWLVGPTNTPLAAASEGLELSAAETTRFAAQSGSKMKIDGTANIIHTKWEVESKIMGGFLEVGPEFPTHPGQDAKPGKVEARAQVFIPVRALKSVEDDKPYSDKMDDIMYTKLKAEEHPRITYKLTELTLKQAASSKNGPNMFDSKGELQIAGVTNNVSFPISILPLGNKKLKVTGTTTVKMSDYKVEKPEVDLVLGKIITDDDVKLTFDWNLIERTAAVR